MPLLQAESKAILTSAKSRPKIKPALKREIMRPSREVSEERPDTLLWLDKNENCDPSFTTFLSDKLSKFSNKALFGYPDCYHLYKKLALLLDVEINQLFIAAGSDGIIRTTYETFVSPGDTVIYTEPTFAMYPIYAEMFGAHSHVLQYKASKNGPLLEKEDVISAILNTRPKLIGLPNPNSPTGTVFPRQELKEIIEAAAEVSAVILIDEAYYPFYEDSAATLIDDYKNLIIARTLSKAWGCAGLRIGYGIANPDLIRECQKMRPMYEAGNLSISLAISALDFVNEMHASVKKIIAGKNYFLNEMEKLNLRTYHCEGNFLHVDFDTYAKPIHAALADLVLYRKNFAHPSLAGFSRFTATTQELFTPIVSVIKRIVTG